MAEWPEGPQRTPLVLPTVSNDERSGPPIHLVVVAFGSEAEARAALADCKELETGKKVKLEDACVVIRNESGAIDVVETAEMGGKGGALRGGLAGALVGAIALVPVAGFAFGAAIGAFFARRHDFGIERDFQQRLGQVLRPGAAALALLVGPVADAEAVKEKTAHWRGEIVVTDLDEDVEQELRAALAER